MGEERYRSFMEGSPDAIVVTSSGRFVYLNSRACDLSGYSAQEFMKLSFEDIIASEYVDLVKSRHSRRLEGESVTELYEIEFITKDGSRIPVEISVALTTYDGSPATLTFIRDISEREKAEKALGESEERYRNFLDGSRDAIAVHSDGRFVYANPEAHKMVGYSHQEFMEMSIEDLIAPEYLDLVRSRIADRYAGKLTSDQYGIEIVAKDGRRIFVELGVSLIDHEGSPASLAFIRDVTERKKAEDALIKSEATLREAQRIARLGNWDWDIVTGGLAWSDVIFTIFGLKPQEFGATYEAFLSYVHPDDRAMVEDAVAEALELNNYEIEHRIILKTGEERTVHERGEVSYDENGEPTRMLGTVIDITERKNAERALVESEAQYRGLFEGLIDAFFFCEVIYDDNDVPINYRYVEINDRYVEVFEKGREIIGQLVTDVWPGIEDELNNWISRYGSVAKGGGELRFEQYLALQDRWFNVSVYSPKPGYFASLLQEITERKRMEDDLRRNQDLLESFMENATDRFYILDEELNIVAVNDIALKKLGFSRQQVIGRHYLDVFPSSRDKGRQEAYERVLKTGEQYSTVDLSDLNDQYRILAFKIEGGMGLITTDVTNIMVYQNRLEALHSSSVRLAKAQELDDICDIAIETISQSLGHTFGTVGCVEGANFVIHRDTLEINEGLAIPLDSKSVIVRSIKTKEIQIVPDISADPDYHTPVPMSEEKYTTRSELCVPVLVEDRAIGALNVESSKLDAFTQDDASHLATLAEHIASAIGRLEYIKGLEAFQRRLEAVHISSTRLVEAETIEQIAFISIEILDQVLKYRWGGMGFVEDDVFSIYDTIDSRPTGKIRVPLDESAIAIRAIKTGKSQLIHDVSKDPDYMIPPGAEEPNQSSLTVPILINAEGIGAFNVESKEKNAFNEDDVKLIETLAQHVASTVRRVRQEDIRAQQFIELTYKLNNLEPGDSYICESHDRCFKVYAELSLHGVPGICLVRDDPGKLVDRYGFDPENVKLLSSRPIKGFEAMNNLQDISRTISSLLKETSGPVILLDGIEYMISLFGFETVYSFLQEKKFDILEANAILLIPVDIGTLDERQRALLSSELKTLT